MLKKLFMVMASVAVISSTLPIESAVARTFYPRPLTVYARGNMSESTAVNEHGDFVMWTHTGGPENTRVDATVMSNWEADVFGKEVFAVSPLDINMYKDVVGFYYDGVFEPHTAFYHKRLNNITYTVSFNNSELVAVNDSRIAVGYSKSEYGSLDYRAFMFNGNTGVTTNLHSAIESAYGAPLYSTEFVDINNSGVALGKLYQQLPSGNYVEHVFTYNVLNGSFSKTLIPAELQAVNFRPIDINNNGDLLVHYYNEHLSISDSVVITSNGYWQVGPVVNTQFPYYNAEGVALNDNGEIVVFMQTDCAVDHYYFLDRNQNQYNLSETFYYELEKPLYYVRDLNNNGYIVGMLEGGTEPAAFVFDAKYYYNSATYKVKEYPTKSTLTCTTAKLQTK